MVGHSPGDKRIHDMHSNSGQGREIVFSRMFLVKLVLPVVEYKKALGKMIWVFIWSQIKSFRHNLFLNYYKKTSLTKVSTFDQLNTKMLSEY